MKLLTLLLNTAFKALLRYRTRMLNEGNPLSGKNLGSKIGYLGFTP